MTQPRLPIDTSDFDDPVFGPYLRAHGHRDAEATRDATLIRVELEREPEGDLGAPARDAA